MNIFYKCEHFDIEELVDRVTYEKWGERAWMFLRAEALYSLDGIRKYFGRPVTVNNWRDGGKFSQRGLRILNDNDKSIYSPYSQHSLGDAFDLDVQGMTSDEVRSAILEDKDESRLEKITCLETDITWVHFDCRNIPDRIRLVKP